MKIDLYIVCIYSCLNLSAITWYEMDLIFFGRMEQEKWFDLILEVLKKYPDISANFTFHICGKGSYQQQLENMDRENIKYYGWVDSSQLDTLIQQADFALMPSRFIETFGLSALEALDKWVPVIGMGKWWCKKFILDELDILKQSWDDWVQGLANILQDIQDYDEQQISNLASKACDTASSFTKQNWINNFQNIFGGPEENSKILLVSDFIVNIGGIEKYILDVKQLLEFQGYEVEIIGWDKSQDISKIDKILGVIRWLRNSKYANRIENKIQEFQPDIVRYHSVLRFLGWKSIAVSQKFDVKTAMMYHDMGYFYPFPSKLESIEQLWELSWINFLKKSHTYNPIILALVTIKYISVLFIRSQILRNIDVNLVPSSFMEDIVSKSYGVGRESIKTLNHYNF